MHRERPNIERREKETTGKVLKFFELSKEEEKALREKIAQHNGIIRLFVHPNYEEYAQSEEREHKLQSAEKLRRMDKAFSRILESSSGKVPPIFVLQNIEGISAWSLVRRFGLKTKYTDEIEAFEDKGDYTKYFTDIHQANNDVYLVPTKDFSPDPLLAYAYDEQEAWDELVDMLKKIGVKKIVIGGAELYTPEKEEYQKMKKVMGPLNPLRYLGGCLGTTIYNFEKNFELELSALTYPQGSKGIRELSKK